MTYGQLLLMLIGAIVVFALFRYANGGSSESSSQPRRGEPMQHLAHERAAEPVTSSIDEDTQELAASAAPVGSYEWECRVADESIRVARQRVQQSAADAQRYLEALREERKKYAWHSNEAHILHALIYNLSAELDERRRQL